MFIDRTCPHNKKCVPKKCLNSLPYYIMCVSQGRYTICLFRFGSKTFEKKCLAEIECYTCFNIMIKFLTVLIKHVFLVLNILIK